MDLVYCVIKYGIGTVMKRKKNSCNIDQIDMVQTNIKISYNFVRQILFSKIMDSEMVKENACIIHTISLLTFFVGPPNHAKKKKKNTATRVKQIITQYIEVKDIIGSSENSKQIEQQWVIFYKEMT